MSDPEYLTEAEIALMDAIKSIIEILQSSNIAEPRAFDKMFSGQRDAYKKSNMQIAAFVMESLREFSTTRGEHRSLLNSPVGGTS